MNHQRQTIYERRRKVLFGGEAEIDEYLNRAIETLIVDPEERSKTVEMIAKKKTELGSEIFYDMARKVILQVADMYWVDHLEALDYMRGSVRLRAYGQRDPLVEFKKEGLNLFRTLESSVYNDVLNTIENSSAAGPAEENVQLEEVHEGAASLTSDRHIEAGQLNKVGRNDPCPCGSGKKWKHCGLLNTAEHRKLTESRG